MDRIWLTACTLVVAACHGRASSVDELPNASPPAVFGTYAIQLCAGPCLVGDTAVAYSHGILVLQEHEVPTSRWARRFRAPLDTVYPTRPALNACFGTYPQPGYKRSFGTLKPVAVTSWRYWPEDSVITFDMLRSPDAGYSVRVKLREGGFAGTGSSGAAGSVALGWAPDSVVGEYLGPPDPVRCFEPLLDKHHRAPA